MDGRNDQVRYGPCSLHSVQIFILAGVVVLSLIIAIASVGGVLAVLLRFMRHPVNSPAPSWGRGDGTVLTRPVGGDIAA